MTQINNRDFIKSIQSLASIRDDLNIAINWEKEEIFLQSDSSSRCTLAELNQFTQKHFATIAEDTQCTASIVTAMASFRNRISEERLTTLGETLLDIIKQVFLTFIGRARWQVLWETDSLMKSLVNLEPSLEENLKFLTIEALGNLLLKNLNSEMQDMGEDGILAIFKKDALRKFNFIINNICPAPEESLGGGDRLPIQFEKIKMALPNIGEDRWKTVLQAALSQTTLNISLGTLQQIAYYSVDKYFFHSVYPETIVHADIIRDKIGIIEKIHVHHTYSIDISDCTQNAVNENKKMIIIFKNIISGSFDYDIHLDTFDQVSIDNVDLEILTNL